MKEVMRLGNASARDKLDCQLARHRLRRHQSLASACQRTEYTGKRRSSLFLLLPPSIYRCSTCFQNGSLDLFLNHHKFSPNFSDIFEKVNGISAEVAHLINPALTKLSLIPLSSSNNNESRFSSRKRYLKQQNFRKSIEVT